MNYLGHEWKLRGKNEGMAQYRQWGTDRGGIRIHESCGDSDHVHIGIRHTLPKQSRHRRFSKSPNISLAVAASTLSILISFSVLAFFFFMSRNGGGINDKNRTSNYDKQHDIDFLTNATQVDRFRYDSTSHGRNSRYMNKDGIHDEDLRDMRTVTDSMDEMLGKEQGKMVGNETGNSVGGGHGLYNEAGRGELKLYEAEHEASLRDGRVSENVHRNIEFQLKDEDIDIDDQYDDGLDLLDFEVDDYRKNVSVADGHEEGRTLISLTRNIDTNDKVVSKQDLPSSENLKNLSKRPVSKKIPDKKKKHRSPCEMKMLNSTENIVEPPRSAIFAHFSLAYTEFEEKPLTDESWVPRFAGHQTLDVREKSFSANDQKINCGFVKNSTGLSSTGFDLAYEDENYINSCEIAVVSCIFGNSDRLRSPTSKMISQMSKKKVCFVMFMDEVTLRTLSSEGKSPDGSGFVNLWKVIVVRNLPYDDMRRVGKIPKLLSHRLFPSARYTIWLDSKLRLQRDPMLILEYLLWRKGYEYAISNHYDRHCVWEEVAQNKKLNKYNHTVIDHQFSFYKADGLTRFNASRPNNLLPSNVPEGSFIVREHTPMSNLFSCLWFNEVERFTPRDQLSFAYTYHKLAAVNPDSPPFRLNMFKDCERRALAKLFHHRLDEKVNGSDPTRPAQMKISGSGFTN